MRKKERQDFVKKVTQLLLELGAKPDGGEVYPFTLQTKAGTLTLHPDSNDKNGLGTVFARFDDPHAARQLVDCNRFSGKWNHHYFDGWTVKTAVYDLSIRLKKVLE